MANILSEPFLGELADRESEIHSKRTAAQPSELVLEVTKEVEADPGNVELWIKLGRASSTASMSGPGRLMSAAMSSMRTSR